MKILSTRSIEKFRGILLLAVAVLSLLMSVVSPRSYAAPQEQKDDVYKNRSFHDTTVLGCVASATEPTSSTSTGEPGNVFVLGDSLSVGIVPKLPDELTSEDGWTIASDTLSGRSINGGGSIQNGVEAAEAKKSDIEVADYVVVVLGTNQDDASKEDIEELLTAIKDAPSEAPIYWLTVNTAEGSNIDNDLFNNTLKTVSGVNIIENTILPPLKADIDGDDELDGDSVHYAADGYASIAKLIAGAVKGDSPAEASGGETSTSSTGACTCPSQAGRTEAGSPGSGQRIGYVSGLAEPYILEQFAIHSLKALAVAKGVPETSTVTEEHVIALVAFAMGEGGDINNRNIFNPLNHGKIDDDNGTLTGDGTSGFVKYSTFDDGVDSTARVLNGGYQQRVATALIDPNVTAYQFMEKLSYWAEFAGDKFWAEASGSGTRSDATTNSYFAGRKSLVDQVRSNWEGTAGLQVGTEAEEQDTGAKIPSQLTYHPAGSTTGSSDTPGGASGGGASCSTESAVTVEEGDPEIDMSKKDSFNTNADGTVKPTITPTGIVLHWTGGPANDNVDKFIEACKQSNCSAQFYVDGDGTIYQLVDPINTLASHAGGANECCLGIEIAGSTEAELLANNAQQQSVVNLTAYLMKQFSIQLNPDIPGLKGVLSHHAIPDTSGSARADVGDKYWITIIAAIQASQSTSTSVPGLDETKIGWLRDSGIPESEWANVNTIVQPESGWNPTNQNPTTSAYGLAQFLDDTWGSVGCEKTDDPVEQLRCADLYVKQRYTDWAGAIEFRSNNGWY